MEGERNDGMREETPESGNPQGATDGQVPVATGSEPLAGMAEGTAPVAPPAGSTPGAALPVSGLAIAGLVLGILAIVGAFVPLLNIFTAPFAIVGLVLAAVGFASVQKGGHSGRGIAIAGIVLGIVALVVTIGMYGCAGAIASSHGDSSSASAQASSSAASPSGAPQQAADASTERAEYVSLSFEVPSGWVAVDAADGGVYYYPSNDDHESLLYGSASQLKGSDSELDAVLDGLANSFEGVRDIEAQDTTVSGHKAKRATFKGTLNGSDYSFRALIIALPDAVEALVGASPDGVYDAQFDATLDSVEVLETAGSSASTASAASAAPEDNGLIDADKFNAIAQGMSYEEVVGIIGSEGTLLSTSTIAGIETSDYQWESDGWGTATVMFQDGVVVNKTQFGVGGSDAKVSLETFNALENGMSYEEVVGIIGGEGELVSETEIAGVSMAIYLWDGNSAFSSCTLTFENGSLNSKTQYGLK